MVVFVQQDFYGVSQAFDLFISTEFLQLDLRFELLDVSLSPLSLKQTTFQFARKSKYEFSPCLNEPDGIRAGRSDSALYDLSLFPGMDQGSKVLPRSATPSDRVSE